MNSYEQLMINYANEKLQQKFTADVFTVMQAEYAAEGLDWRHIEYLDNSNQVRMTAAVEAAAEAAAVS